MTAYYNEFDPQAAAWLRELIKQGHIAAGDVDDRDMMEVHPDDLKGYTQHHFFAGIGGWSLALRYARWDDTRPVLTGSPPCQPFSTAGKGLGAADERHLAPHFLRLVSAIRPACVFGEQVAAAVNKDNWLDDLLDALEAEGYATGAIVLPACSVGAPHTRQRLWFTARLADTSNIRQSRQREVGRSSNTAQKGDREKHRVEHDGWGGGVVYASGSQCETARLSSGVYAQHSAVGDASAFDGLVRGQQIDWDEAGLSQVRSCSNQTGWDDPDWLFCRDGKWRPVESGTFPLANGVSARVGRLRGYGNAIVPQVAEEIIREMMRGHDE